MVLPPTPRPARIGAATLPSAIGRAEAEIEVPRRLARAPAELGAHRKVTVLEEEHRAPALGELVRRRRASRARTDDDDLALELEIARDGSTVGDLRHPRGALGDGRRVDAVTAADVLEQARVVEVRRLQRREDRAEQPALVPRAALAPANDRALARLRREHRERPAEPRHGPRLGGPEARRAPRARCPHRASRGGARSERRSPHLPPAATRCAASTPRRGRRAMRRS